MFWHVGQHSRVAGASPAAIAEPSHRTYLPTTALISDLDFVVDFGAVKGSGDEYPALSYLRNGRADVLLVVRVPVFDSRQSGDLLESLAKPEGQAVACLTVPDLRRLGLLPPAVGVPGMALQRAAELRGKRFPFAAIARWLDTEGYAPPSEVRGHWSRAEVVALLRSVEAVSERSKIGEASDGAAGML